MKLQKLSLLVLAALSAPVTVMAGDSPIAANVGLYSDYVFRGMSQTDVGPAIQGGFDYSNDSGIYLGTWESNVDTNFLNGANIEMDFYGGYSGKVNDDLSYNVGLLQYYYPGQTNGPVDINTLEAYGSVTYKWFTGKVSYNLDNYFGVANSDGTVYYDLSFAYTLPYDIGFSAHYGWTRYAGTGNGVLDYDDYKIGVSKEFSGLTFGLAYTDTDTTVLSAKPGSTNDLAKGLWTVSVSKAF